MDLFAITCTTCKSRLRVRDTAAVGQILACPKCGGMVMVKPPPAWQEAGEQKSDLPTATEVEGRTIPFNETANSSAFDVLEELLSDAPPKVQPPLPAAPASLPAAGTAVAAANASTKPRFVGGPPVVKRSATPPPGVAPPSATPATAGPIPPAVKSTASAASAGAANGKTAAPPAPEAKATAAPSAETHIKHEPAAKQPVAKPAAAKEPAAGAPRKQWPLMAGSVGVGVLVVFIAISSIIHFLRPANVGRPIPPRPSRSASAAASLASIPAETQPAAETIATTNDPGQESVNPAPPSATNADAGPVASSTAQVPVPTPASASDPLGLVGDAPAVVATPPATTDPLAKFDRILGGGADDAVAKSTARPADTAPLPQPDAGPPKPIAPRPAPREIDVARRLADPLPGIETAPSGTPLAEFVQIMSDLSTIPITLDVPFVPVTAESAVSLRLTNTTVGNAISEALRPLRLEYVIDNDQLVIRRAEPARPTPFSIPLKNLASDEQQMHDLADLLRAVVEPAAWGEGENGGSIAVDTAKGSLAVTHRRAVQFQVLLAVEKLREAHTPPLAHEVKLDPLLFKLDTRTALAKSRLEKTVSLTYTQPTRLLTILERLHAASGVRMLVDWRDIAAAGWNPAGEATLVVKSEPLSAALDALLTPLDLTWRVIDGQTVQVVTPARLAEQGELEFYKIDDLLAGGKTSDDLLAKIRAALGEPTFTASGGIGEIRFDDASKTLLAWLPQPKQRELESLLAKLRGEKAS